MILQQVRRLIPFLDGLLFGQGAAQVLAFCSARRKSFILDFSLRPARVEPTIFDTHHRVKSVC
jgi:hypothetical protein